jgi:hypothetical protein
MRKSMDTRDWTRARRNLDQIEDPNYGLRECVQPGCNELVERGRCERHIRDIGRAVQAYHDAHQDASEGTRRNRRRALRFFEDFITARGCKTVDQIDLEALHAFRGLRKLGARSWTKELEILSNGATISTRL